MPKETVILLGSGNLGSHLGRALDQAGHAVVQVYSHNISNARSLAMELECLATDNISEIEKWADIYVLCVKDDAIASIAKQLKLPGKIVVHTSGTLPMEILDSTEANKGVFYPLQTFTKTRTPEWNKIPVCIEADSPETGKVLARIAGEIAGKVHYLDSEKRKWLHLAAVFVNNFTNFMLQQAEHIAKENDLPFQILKSLAFETLQKAFDMGPATAQTGPARRGDEKIINEHLKMLESEPRLKEIYRIITENIRGNN